ncbi:SDR family oxidoreductase [Sphingobium sp. EP60837]|uniref:SDR family oxidoreductase n=1 Tax=Sphingobium sp. EP60837 TaxID=1855519 RepID=UPI0007DD1B12|nr:SDR family oxidoreductase [Sphingobium sp. EP60837]ANI80135.1 3-oxoacyl-[acyl-carrier-protein] reductase [Sphingobium sp. EP60837]
MDLGIDGKRAVVIGGSSGLGYGVCERLAAEGVNLLIFARDREKLQDAKKRLVDKNPRSTIDIVAGDISNAEDIERLKREIIDSGGMQILVLNTPPPPRPLYDFLEEHDEERWENAYQWQLKGALLVLRKLAPLLLNQGWGRIVAITSASIKEPLPNHALSTVFRAGVQAALKHLSMEMAAHNVTVNSVAPAVVVTSTYHTVHDIEARVSRIPLKRVGKVEELAATVAFLASDLAGFITGENVQVDGGCTRSLC